ncbi:MAG: phage major capsid protein [Oscillospiraceae bacterium]|nr:phage major capsid protein [Oscillospiraceae bacterium]
MKSKDVIKQELHEKFSAALSGENPEQITDALTQFAVDLQADVVNDFKAYQQTQDSSILAARGIRQLTAEERKYYTGWMSALKEHYNSPKMAFTGLDNTTLPQTVVDQVLSDIGTTFPLLSAINFQNTAAITKMIVNRQGMQLATWGALNTAVATELSGAIGTVDITLNKLTAFMAVSRDMLDVGPEWMDAYVRAVLAEALGYGLSQGIVGGTGKDQPIGMIKDLDGSVTNGVYPDKTAVTITDLSVATIGGIAATLAQGPNNRKRPVPSILIVVNPVDYFEKFLPATTYLTTVGTYVNNVLPYPSNIVQDINVPSGKAVFGLASKYFMGVGKGGSGGQLEYSDEFQFLDDNRVYKIKMYGNGMPLDNNAFVFADISGLTPLKHQVLVVNPITNPVNTKAVSST